MSSIISVIKTQSTPDLQDYSDLCMYCDEHVARDCAEKEYDEFENLDEYDELYDIIIDQMGKCRECHISDIGND